MGLSSLIRVAEGKNAGNVSFEANFLKAYEEAVRRKELAERQVAPSDYIRPSSMYGCERMIFFQRVHSGSLNGEQDDVPLIEICQSGTDRHLDIQHIIEMMEGVECLDLEEVVKEANQKGIKTEFLGWNEDHTEARCKNDELSIYFQPDGVIRFMGKEVIVEVKTESTYQFSNRYEPKEDHKWQGTSYGMGLGIDWVLFIYEDRNFCRKKIYLWKITDDMKEKVRAKIHTVNTAVKTGIPPEKNEDKCTYCKYKNECKLADDGKWVNPRQQEPTEKPKKAKKGNSKGKSKKPSESPKTASAKGEKAKDICNITGKICGKDGKCIGCRIFEAEAMGWECAY